MARMVYGDGYGDIANRELAMDAARDTRYFQSLAANRAAQAMRLQAAQSQAGNQLSWEQLLAQAALSSRNRDDDITQRNFTNRLRLADIDRSIAGDTRHQSNILEDLALRRRGMDLQYGPEQRSDRALGRFEKLAPSLADDPAITEESLATMRPDLTPDDLSVAQAMFRSNRRKLMEDEAERANATAMANRQILTEQRAAYSDYALPKINREETAAMGQGTRWPINPKRWSWFGGSKASPEDVERYKASIGGGIQAGEFDVGGLEPLPPSDAADIFREVSKNRRLAPSAYDEQAGRFEFAPRFTTPQTNTAAAALQPRATIIKYDPRSGRPIAYDAVTKQAIGYAD